MIHWLLSRHGFLFLVQTSLCAALILHSSVPGMAARKSARRSIPEPEAEKSLVVFVRPKFEHSKAHTNFIFANRTLVATLDNDCYSYALIEPGEVLVWPKSLRQSTRTVLKQVQTHLAVVDWDRVGTIRRSTLDEITRVVQSVGSLCEPTAGEREKAQDYLIERPPGIFFLWSKDCRRCKRIKTASKITEWPQVDLTPYTELEIEVIVTSKKAQKTKRIRRAARMTETRLPTTIERKLEPGVFEKIIDSQDDAMGNSVLLKVDFTRYYGGKYLPNETVIKYVDFEVALADSSRNRELARFSGFLPWYTNYEKWYDPDITVLEDALAYALAGYLELSKYNRGVDRRAGGPTLGQHRFK